MSRQDAERKLADVRRTYRLVSSRAALAVLVCREIGLRAELRRAEFRLAVSFGRSARP